MGGRHSRGPVGGSEPAPVKLRPEPGARQAGAPRHGEEQDRRAREDPEGGNRDGDSERLRGPDTGRDQGCTAGANLSLCSVRTAGTPT
jgi:hypothetical protein